MNIGGQKFTNIDDLWTRGNIMNVNIIPRILFKKTKKEKNNKIQNIKKQFKDRMSELKKQKGSTKIRNEKKTMKHKETQENFLYKC